MKNKILIVDDVLQNLRLLVDIFKEHDYEIVIAKSGKEAIEFAMSKLQPDIILLDILMPGMNGYEVARRLKDNTQTASIPIIFLSALGETEDKIRAFENGGVDYITKPFEPIEVLARVKTHLELYQMKLHLEEEVIERTSELNNSNIMLAQKEDQYKNLVESLHEGYMFYTHDTDGIFTYVSPSVKSILGYTQEEFLTNYTEYMTDNLANEKAKKATNKAMQGKSHIPYEVEMIHHDGMRCWLEISEHPVLDEKMKVVQVEGIARDITARKVAEEALRIQVRDKKLILDSVGEGIFGLDLDGKYTFVNPAAAKMLGYSEEELIGKHSHKRWHDEHHEGTNYPEENTLVCTTLKSDIPAYMGEEYFVRRDGSKFPATITSQPIIEDAKAIGAVVSFLDISERLKIEAEIKEKDKIMMAQSRQAAMGDMIAMIAHQWRQPLAIIGMVENNLLASIELGEEIGTDFLLRHNKHVNIQIQHLSKTIDDFRNFFKKEQNKEIVSIEDVLQEMMSLMQKSLENHNILIEINNKSNTKLSIYSNQLLQVLINIINNAKDILIGNEIDDAKIVITVNDTKDSVITTICDNGGGIPKDIINKIGEPYFTTKKMMGTGLGIYMSKTIITKHLNAKLTWENINDGACFIITLPKK